MSTFELDARRCCCCCLTVLVFVKSKTIDLWSRLDVFFLSSKQHQSTEGQKTFKYADTKAFPSLPTLCHAHHSYILLVFHCNTVMTVAMQHSPVLYTPFDPLRHRQ